MLERIAVAAAWTVMTLLAIAIALYAAAFLFVGRKMFPPDLAASFTARPWGIYPHAFFGAVALAFGSVQFRRKLRDSHPKLHRVIGRVYVVAALGTAAAGLYMSFFAFGGAVTSLGFGLLAIGVLLTTSTAFARIRRGNVASHREWMLRSYALIFAAVTLRIELPILIALLGGFPPAYAVVAWLCWVPNILCVEVYIRRSVASQLGDVRVVVPSHLAE